MLLRMKINVLRYLNNERISGCTRVCNALAYRFRRSVNVWLDSSESSVEKGTDSRHDVGHFGVNNAYCMESYLPISIIYNDTAPLENMHCALLFMLMAQLGDSQNMSGLRQRVQSVVRLLRHLPENRNELSDRCPGTLLLQI